MSILGWFHFLLALSSIGLGAYIFLTLKGTFRHRMVGRVFVACMLIVNIAALTIYRISGSWNLFHTLALLSLSLLVVGMVPLWLRRPKQMWLVLHSSSMTGAYIGLVTAGLAQITVQYIETNSSVVLWLTIAVAFGVGGYLSSQYLPSAMANSTRR